MSSLLGDVVWCISDNVFLGGTKTIVLRWSGK